MPSEAEMQLLAMLRRALDENEATDRGTLERLGGSYGAYRLAWSEAFETLTGAGLVTEQDGRYALTPLGERQAADCLRARPDIWWYWYRDFYTRASDSAAHAAFCERVYGKNLCQHGMMDMIELGRLLEVLDLGPDSRVVDLGCGNGFIAEYIADRAGARVLGLDYSDVAIEQARRRTEGGNKRLDFRHGDMNALELPQRTFDTAISIDTLYFAVDLKATLEAMLPALTPAGQMGIFFTQWLEPGDSPDLLHADRTRLARALTTLGLPYRCWDFTDSVRRHWTLNKEASEALKARFEAEGNGFLYEFRVIECGEFMGYVEADAISRHLYHVRL